MKSSISYRLLTKLLIALLVMLSIQNPAVAYETHLDFSGATIAFDISHGGYHIDFDDLAPITNNLTSAGNEVIFINEIWDLPDSVDALFLTQSDDYFTANEITDIKNWYELGDKLLWVSGDSDYGAYYNPDPINIILEELEAITRLDSSSIYDEVYNDGADFRVVAPYIGWGDPFYDQFSEEVGAGIEAGVLFHGPCSILAFDGYYYKDLRYGYSIFPERVMVIMTYSENATANDSSLSAGDLDLYVGLDGGLFPAIVYENMTVFDSHLIVSGEAIFTSFKKMYDQNTESGTYNGGLHYGQMLVNNILNYFVGDQSKVTPSGTETVTTTPKGTLQIEYQGTLYFLASIMIISIPIIKKRKNS